MDEQRFGVRLWCCPYMSATYAVLVAVEKYDQKTISGVPYAVADAEAMRDVLINKFLVPPENIHFWANEHATRSRFEEDLKYEITTLGPDDQFIFFYAGHGFHDNGFNRLTTWETRTVNTEGTTVSLDKVLLTPLKNSACRKSLLFIDACASTFGDLNTRSLLSDMKAEEFAAFVKSAEYRAAFFSCSPGQRSYSSAKVKHGIWTYHLLQALGGAENSAIERDRCITGQSLHNYLVVSVPNFIREKTDIKDHQRPYAELAGGGTFEILTLPKPPEADESVTSSLPIPVPAGDQQTIDPASNTSSASPDGAQVAAAEQQYWDQRKRLADTLVIQKIWSLPRWRLWCRPLEFRKARFRDLEDCAAFVASESVRSRSRWTQYPWFQTSPTVDAESVAAEIDFNEAGVQHTERWALFQSGQFVHNRALDRIEQLKKHTDILELLDVTTAFYEFTARMADRKVLTGHVGITIELLDVTGRQLAWKGRLAIDGWSTQKSIRIDKVHTTEELRSSRRKLALDVTIELCPRFGVPAPSRDELEEIQHERFDPKQAYQ